MFKHRGSSGNSPNSTRLHLLVQLAPTCGSSFVPIAAVVPKKSLLGNVDLYTRYTPTTLPRSRSPHNVGFGRSTALFSYACSRLTSRISPWCATLVWSTHGLNSAFFHVGRQFGTSRPNTLACMRVPETTAVVPNESQVIVTPNNT